MAILNYTTQVPAEKTAMEIQKSLVKAGVLGFMTRFKDGVMVSITFQLEGPNGMIYFDLPANVEKVHAVLKGSDIGPKYKTADQAARVAWRIIKVWIKAQLAFVETEMVEMEEVFLPYMQTDDGQTVYKRLSNNQFLLPRK